MCILTTLQKRGPLQYNGWVLALYSGNPRSLPAMPQEPKSTEMDESIAQSPELGVTVALLGMAQTRENA